MLKIFIQGLKDGDYPVEAETNVTAVKDIFPEFFGVISFNGLLKIIGKRYTLTGVAKCNARLICDLSVEEYIEEITASVHCSFLAEDIHHHRTSEGDDEVNEFKISDDDKYIDITLEVIEELEVSLPMKRVAPHLRGKTFDELYPELVPGLDDKKDESEPIDDRWAALKNLKLN